MTDERPLGERGADDTNEELNGGLGPSEHDHYRLLSIAYRVRSTDARFTDALRWHLAPFRRTGPDPQSISITMRIREEDAEEDEPWYSFFIGYELRFRHRLLTEVLSHAIWDLHSIVPKWTKDFVLLHAGAVTSNGGAWLLPARMDSGKSSLVIALLELGFGYLSDEVGAIDPITGRAYPFEKRLTLDWTALRLLPGLRERLADRPDLTRQLAQTFLEPEDLGTITMGPSPIQTLVFPAPVWDGPPNLVPIRRSEAVQLMATNSFNLYRYGERGVVLLSRIAAEAPAFRLEGGTPRQRAQILAERLA